MAIFKSSLLSDVRGSLNGATFSRTRAGNILRNRTQPVQPNTAFQSDQRSFMQAATDLFKDLSVADVAAWNDAISLSGFTMQNALGDTYTPSAKQVFTMAALNLSKYNNAPIAPELSKFLSDSNLPGLTYGNLVVTVDIGPPVALDSAAIADVTSTVNAVCQVAATLPISRTIRNYKKYLRTIGYFPVTPVASNVVFTTEYETRFPGIDWTDAEGSVINVAIRALNLDTGLAGSWLYIGGDEVPPAA